MLDLAVESDLGARFRMAVLNYDEDEVEVLLTDPHTMLGLSDAGAHASQLCDSCFSTHLLSRWVRERKALTLEEAVRKLTSEPADIFGITDRGRLAVGPPGRRRRVRSRHRGLLRPAPGATTSRPAPTGSSPTPSASTRSSSTAWSIRRDGADVVDAAGPLPGSPAAQRLGA